MLRTKLKAYQSMLNKNVVQAMKKLQASYNDDANKIVAQAA